jgi:hypothetical protein
MRIDFIGHATLLVRSGSTSLLTDPWWDGPAYHGQWHQYPVPVPERHDFSRLSAVYLTHGHEDHTHAPTLRHLTHARALLPRWYDGDNAEMLRDLGFSRVDEIGSGDTLRIGPMSLTVFSYLGDSILVIDDGREVAVDVNDALHCARDEVIDEYARVIRERFPSIDYLFCGFGGASYFPNCFRVPGKNDEAVARRRESLFLSKFARIVKELGPTHAFPFAAHFVLPDERNWWISELRLRGPDAAATLAELCRGLPTRIHALAPGDGIEDGVVHQERRRPILRPDEVRALVRARCPAPELPPLDVDGFHRMLELVRSAARANASAVPALDAAIRLWDHPARMIRVRTRERSAEVTAVDAPASAPLILETRSDLLEAAMTEAFGRDQICIGYGGIMRIASADAVRANLHERLLDLVAPVPSWRDRLLRDPLRCGRFLLNDPGARLALMEKLRRRRSQSPVYALEGWSGA